MPLYPPSTSGASTPVGVMGLLATTPSAVTTGYTWTYAAQAKAFPAYTSNPQGAAYAGGLLDLLQAARLTDLNAVRVAMENLRVFTENLAQQHNAISIALRDAGLISN
jgi:hypothetical protein